jgi:hypothetical protein
LIQLLFTKPQMDFRLYEFGVGVVEMIVLGVEVGVAPAK